MTRYLLDTNVLISYLRGDEDVRATLLAHVRAFGSLCSTAVTVQEIERGIRPAERRRTTALMDRLDYLPPTKEAAERAGRYQREFTRRGRTIHSGDALMAGTARAYGAILITDDVGDFPMRDLRVQRPR